MMSSLPLYIFSLRIPLRDHTNIENTLEYPPTAETSLMAAGLLLIVDSDSDSDSDPIHL